MYRTVANRALAILENFVTQQYNSVDIWIIPSTLCFSVPFLFIKNQKKITFVDFGYDEEEIIKIIAKFPSKKIGILLCSYYGKNWDINKIKIIRPYVECIIEDACLAFPIIDSALAQKRLEYADLLVFSTGKAKTVEVKYGAYSYSNSIIDVSQKNKNEEDIAQIEENYMRLDEKWKDNLLNNKNNMPLDSIFDKEWINKYPLDKPKGYLEKVSCQKTKVEIHKKELNSIYINNLPKELVAEQDLHNWRFTIFVDKPKVVLNKLLENGLFASNHYANTAKRIQQKERFVKSDFIENHILNLFNDFYFDSQKAFKTTEVINNLFKNNYIYPVKHQIL